MKKLNKYIDNTNIEDKGKAEKWIFLYFVVDKINVFSVSKSQSV